MRAEDRSILCVGPSSESIYYMMGSSAVNRYIQLFRIGNCIMGVVGLLIGVLIATGMSIFDYSAQIAIASLLVFTFIIGGNSLNDYMDREIDKVGHPEDQSPQEDQHRGPSWLFQLPRSSSP